MAVIAKKASAKLVGIVDDNPQHRQALIRKAKLAGFAAVSFESKFAKVADLVSAVRKEKVYGVLCDHRLQEGNFANFFGAQAVAELYKADIPAVLVTDYSAVDLDRTIRPYRRWIPLVMPTGTVDPDGIEAALERCDLEVRQHKVPITRRPRRAIVLVEEVRESPTGKQVVAFVPQWNPNEAVSFPLELIPEDLHSLVEPNATLLAAVNIDAESGDDLYFDEFERPPEEKS